MADLGIRVVEGLKKYQLQLGKLYSNMRQIFLND